ncbi:M20 family metallopeptidase [Longirhabdus pacifica]|uniref:M20 family metallopeptidase n=1 Tax=Longirhabdus pacifica TaxID=2305227 RepID=UPI001F0C04EB|nr:M20 family metallopeptidase [Longirhabdus pacifica]
MHTWMTRLKELYPEMVEWRRHMHQYPELSYQEKNTTHYVAEKLKEWNIPYRFGTGGSGIIADITSDNTGPTIALRADMDALPITEESDFEFRSQHEGIMHACGHDAHTATLLGIAKLLNENKANLPYHVRLLFQHAEELPPGGAISLIKDGALDGVDVIYGVHIWTPLEVGKVSSAPGELMAAADEFKIKVMGKGGHGAMPHQTIDSTLIGAQLTVQLQSIVSRNINPLDPAVVTVGSLQAGTAFNVIADTCEMQGTVRTFSEDTRQFIRQRIMMMTEHTCASFDAKHELDYIMGYPAVVNDEKEAARFFDVANNMFDKEHVSLSEPVMGAEDFAYYLKEVPGCFMFVGAANTKKGYVYPHHHPKFRIDEECMFNAAMLFLAMMDDYVAEK